MVYHWSPNHCVLAANQLFVLVDEIERCSVSGKKSSLGIVTPFLFIKRRKGRAREAMADADMREIEFLAFKLNSFRKTGSCDTFQAARGPTSTTSRMAFSL